jgi:hypothetical protein
MVTGWDRPPKAEPLIPNMHPLRRGDMQETIPQTKPLQSTGGVLASYWERCYMLTLILLVFAFVCFALAAFWTPNPPRVNLIAAGLAFWVLSVILAGHPMT